MPRRHRLAHEQHAALSGGRRFHGKLFSLAVSPLPAGHARFACVVSKKVMARAVGRNQLKRRCREAAALKVRGIKKPLALVFHAKKAAAGASFADIRSDVDDLLHPALSDFGIRSPD